MLYLCSRFMQKKEYTYPKIEVVTLQAESRIMKNFDLSNTTPDPAPARVPSRKLYL